MYNKHFFKSVSLSALLVFSALSNADAAQKIDLEEIKTQFQNGQYQQLIQILELKDKSSISPEVFTYFIYSYSQLDLDEAEEVAEQAIKVHTDSADLLLVHADIMGQQAQNSIFSALSYAKKALSSLQKAVALQPNETKYLNGLMSFYLAAPSIAGGDTDKALVQAEAIAQLDEEQGYGAMARYYQATDKPSLAIESLSNGLKVFPQSMSILNQLAQVHTMNENYIDAINTFKQITNLNLAKLIKDFTPKDQDDEQEAQITSFLNAHYQIARIALTSKTELQTGVQYMEKYLSLYDQLPTKLANLPSKDWANLRLSGLLYELGEYNQAYEAISKINDSENNQMEKIYKALNKKIKKKL